MGVYIKGMEMPKDCDSCPMLDDNGDYPTCILTWTSHGYNWNPFGQRMPDCPLVPVPPHGRLIDADALDKTMQFIGEAEAQIYGSQSWGFAMKCRKALCDAPTIIPASKEGET